MNELTSTRIHTAATKLSLPNLADNLSALVQRAEEAQMGYLDFLDLVTGEEAALKDDRRFHHQLRLARLPHRKTLEDFDFTFQPDLDVRKVRDLAAMEFLTTPANIALLGPPGTGKTHLATSLGVAACQAGYNVYFTSLDNIVTKMRAADAIGRLENQMRPFIRPALLIIDEVGYRPLDRTDANLFFQLISRRYERSATIVTSNKAFTEWGTIFNDEVLATAILDRFLHHCHVITINGPSWRLKDRLAALEGQEQQTGA